MRGLARRLPLLREQQQVELHALLLQGGAVSAAARPLDRLPVEPRVRNQGEAQELTQAHRGGRAAAR